MRTHAKTDPTSFANGFLLLAVVAAGVLNIGLPGRDPVSGHHGHKVLYRIELVFNAEFRSTFPVLSVSQNIPGNDVVADRTLLSHFYSTCSGSAVCVMRSRGLAIMRPSYFPQHRAASFNIPHQNSDEDEALILHVDVA